MRRHGNLNSLQIHWTRIYIGQRPAQGSILQVNKTLSAIQLITANYYICHKPTNTGQLLIVLQTDQHRSMVSLVTRTTSMNQWIRLLQKNNKYAEPIDTLVIKRPVQKQGS